MTYEEFKIEMQALLTKSFTYRPGEVGASIYTEKMAGLAGAFPAYEEMLDDEI